MFMMAISAFGGVPVSLYILLCSLVVEIFTATISDSINMTMRDLK